MSAFALGLACFALGFAMASTLWAYAMMTRRR